MGMKTEVLEKILENAKQAKPIEEIGPHTYDPANYNKVRGKEIAMSNLDNAAGVFYEPKFMPGDVEFDANGNLKSIGRNMPKMIDPYLATANKYKLFVPDEDNEDKGFKTHINVIFGFALVQAIEKTNELPPQVKAYRFNKSGDGKKANWNYVGASFISADEARTYSHSLNPEAVYKLRAEMNNRKAKEASENSNGDGLDDLKI